MTHIPDEWLPPTEPGLQVDSRPSSSRFHRPILRWHFNKLYQRSDRGSISSRTPLAETRRCMLTSCPVTNNFTKTVALSLTLRGIVHNNRSVVGHSVVLWVLVGRLAGVSRGVQSQLGREGTRCDTQPVSRPTLRRLWGKTYRDHQPDAYLSRGLSVAGLAGYRG